MASSNKTPNFGLSQWVGSDKPTRVDFNADNLILDTNAAKLTNPGDTNWDSGSLAIESGVWNPRIYGGTTAGTPTFAISNAVFDLIHTLVICRATITLTSKGGMQGNVTIGDFPFISKATYESTPRIQSIALPSGAVLAALTINANSKGASITYKTNAGIGYLTDSHLTDTSAINFTLIYIKA